MARVIEVSEPGGLEKLRVVERELPALPSDAVQIKQAAAGVNFVDIYHRQGKYKLPAYPGVPGLEGVGVITKVGSAVTQFQEGERVSYFEPAGGGYASERVIRAARCVKIDPQVGDPVGAVCMLRGLTALLLTTRSHKVDRGHRILVMSAGGGLGALLSIVCKRAGAWVVGVVGSQSKARAAKDAFCDEVILREGDWAHKVKSLAGEGGVQVAYDGTGGETVLDVLRCVRRNGTLFNFGQASGPVDARLEAEAKKAHVKVEHPSVLDEFKDDAQFQAGAAMVMTMLRNNINPHIGRSYKLSQAAQAQSDLESGKSVGSLVLLSDV